METANVGDNGVLFNAMVAWVQILQNRCCSWIKLHWGSIQDWDYIGIISFLRSPDLWCYIRKTTLAIITFSFTVSESYSMQHTVKNNLLLTFILKKVTSLKYKSIKTGIFALFEELLHNNPSFGLIDIWYDHQIKHWLLTNDESRQGSSTMMQMSLVMAHTSFYLLFTTVVCFCLRWLASERRQTHITHTVTWSHAVWHLLHTWMPIHSRWRICRTGKKNPGRCCCRYCTCFVFQCSWITDGFVQKASLCAYYSKHLCNLHN